MFQLAAQPPAAPQVAQATDGVTNFFLLLAVAAFAIVLLRLFRPGELSGVITAVGGLIATVVIMAAVALMIFVVLGAFHTLLAF
jgi:hypothetical protein